MSRAALKKRIVEAMASIDEPTGGRKAWADAVLEEINGEIEDFGREMALEALATITGEILRSSRDPITNGKLYHNIREKVGLDEDGNPVFENQYWRATDVYKDQARTDQVVDYYGGQARAYMVEANNTVKHARIMNPSYQRPLPFPDMDKESGAA